MAYHYQYIPHECLTFEHERESPPRLCDGCGRRVRVTVACDDVRREDGTQLCVPCHARWHVEYSRWYRAPERCDAPEQGDDTPEGECDGCGRAWSVCSADPNPCMCPECGTPHPCDC